MDVVRNKKYKSYSFTREEHRWFAVEHVHNQLTAILKKGAENLQPNDLGEVTLTPTKGNFIYVPSKDQLMLVHKQINTELKHRFKGTHPPDASFEEHECHICSFLKNDYDRYKEKFGWQGPSDSALDISYPTYMNKP